MCELGGVKVRVGVGGGLAVALVAVAAWLRLREDSNYASEGAITGRLRK